VNEHQQICFLIENYYDMQKLRVAAFNRIVAYVTSHCDIETQIEHASQVKDGTHIVFASQRMDETQPMIASHYRLETQNNDASHESDGSHSLLASQLVNGTHEDLAVKPSILAQKIIVGKQQVPNEISTLVWYHNSLHHTEKELAKHLNAWSSKCPLRIHYLSKIKGIGPILSSGLIAWLEPISRFSNISKLWSYCGLSPTQKRVKGKKLNYNPRLKTLMWKIATSFEKQNKTKSQYRLLYERQKAYYRNREDLKAKITAKEKGIDGHVRNMTLRYVVKRFLANLWLEWRRLEGLTVTMPWVIAEGGHSNYEPPMTDDPQI
jgi:hypothetical protein